MMSEKKNKKNRYEKRFQFQQKMISKLLKENEELKLKLKEKDEIINSVEPMRKEMTENIREQKKLKNDYKKLIEELKKMKSIINQEVYKGRWWLIKFFLK